MRRKQNKMTSREEGTTAPSQHTAPCQDCPFLRTAIPGWLGGSTPDSYRKIAHSDTTVQCHVITNQQCAGVAIYRRNTAKKVYPPNLELPKDTDAVFSNPMEFMAHHEKLKNGSGRSG